jgi:hypothetical protein
MFENIANYLKGELTGIFSSLFYFFVFLEQFNYYLSFFVLLFIILHISFYFSNFGLQFLYILNRNRKEGKEKERRSERREDCLNYYLKALEQMV